MSDKQPPIDQDATRIAARDRLADTRIADMPTRVSTQSAATDSPASHSASDASTKNTTQYTRYNVSHAHSTGFAKAHALAQETLNNSGMLLKKRFVLEEILGHGGMGTVYKAKDLRKVEAEDPYPYIAAKVLNQDFKDHPDAFVALQQEAAKSHTLAHPNIVTVHDFDRDGDVLFMTMELLEGQPLDEVFKHKKILTKPRALKITRDLCAALAYAHQRQIIHADFKPGNVFVMQDGSAKVLDFGIARAATKESQRHKFDAGQLGALTPAYATIEMVNDEPLTFTDDVYALACVVYELFSGRHPYANRSAYTAKQQGLKLKRIDTLNKREWRALQHALALNKAQRTLTIKQFVQEFFPRRSSLALKAAIFMSILGAGGAGWFAYQQYQAEVQIDATINEKLLQAQTCFATSDFVCSIDNARVVLNLQNDHSLAANLLNNAQLALQQQQSSQELARLVQATENCLQVGDYACAQLKARELLIQNPNHTYAQQLLSDAKAMAQTAELTELGQQVDGCLLDNDLSCATLFSEKAVAINAEHSQTLAIQTKVLIARQQSQLASATLAQQLAELVSTGQTCLNQKKYVCALEQANGALAIDSNYGPAISLRQSASLGQQQAQEGEAKVKTILAEASTCLDQQKNYSCAIAKAEAALAIIPNHPQAKEIKQRAEETQQRIKDTGFTIR